MGVGGQHQAPAALPPGNTRYPLYRRLGGSQGRYGQVRKISHRPGFDPRTVQPVASRYTDWDIEAPEFKQGEHKKELGWDLEKGVYVYEWLVQNNLPPSS